MTDLISAIMTSDEMLAWRQRHGLSVRQTALFFGVCDQQVRNWANGRPICAWHRSLAVSADELNIPKMIEIGAVPADVLLGAKCRKMTGNLLAA
jgi:hypothetical protein